MVKSILFVAGSLCIALALVFGAGCRRERPEVVRTEGVTAAAAQPSPLEAAGDKGKPALADGGQPATADHRLR